MKIIRRKAITAGLVHMARSKRHRATRETGAPLHCDASKILLSSEHSHERSVGAVLRTELMRWHMGRNQSLAVSVSNIGIFIRFIAGDDSETHINALDVIKGSSALTNGPLLQWYRDRLNEARKDEIPNAVRKALEEALDDIAAFGAVDLEKAIKAGATINAIEFNVPKSSMRDWLEQAKGAAEGATGVLISAEAYRTLIDMAKNGCSPGCNQ